MLTRQIDSSIIMPKEKATRKTKAKVESAGKKKKGEPLTLLLRGITNYHQSPDPNAPKRGLSAYMFFANEQRENVREENPGISFGTDLYRQYPSDSNSNDAQCRPSRQGARRTLEGTRC